MRNLIDKDCERAYIRDRSLKIIPEEVYMAVFSLRNDTKGSTQLPLQYWQSPINISAELYNVLAREAVKEMGEKGVALLTMELLLGIERDFRQVNPSMTTVVVARQSKKVYLHFIVLNVADIKDPEDPWERIAVVKVLFPVASLVASHDNGEQDAFLETVCKRTKVFGRVEQGGLVLRIPLFGSDMPIEQENPDERRGRAWKYFVRNGEIPA